MADPFSNPDSRYVVQPAETSADTFQLTAVSGANVAISATSAAVFVAGASGAACLARVMLKVTINGVVHYVPCSTVAW